MGKTMAGSCYCGQVRFAVGAQHHAITDDKSRRRPTGPHTIGFARESPEFLSRLCIKTDNSVAILENHTSVGDRQAHGQQVRDLLVGLLP